MKELTPQETDVIGGWTTENDRVIDAEAEQRIGWLIANALEKMAIGASGWEILYRDRTDNRFWELTYPHGEMVRGASPAWKTPRLKQNIEWPNSNYRHCERSEAIQPRLALDCFIPPRSAHGPRNDVG